MITIENADKALKTYYLDALSAQLNQGISPFFAAIEKNSNSVCGKDVKMLVNAGPGGSVVAGSEDGDLPAPYANRYYDITVPLKNIYGTIEISDKALRASQNAEGAFVNLVNAEMEGLVSSAKFNFQRMLYGNGSGFLANVTARVSASKFKVDYVKYFHVGMKVDLLDMLEAVKGGADVTVTDVDYAGSYVTVSGSVAEADYSDTCAFYLHGAYGNELCGLSYVFSDKDIYGYKRSTDGYFKPNYYTAAVDKLTEELLAQIVDDLEEKYGSKPDMILCPFSARRKIAAMLTANKRVLDTAEIQGGYGAILFNGIPVVADKFCPENKVFVLNTADFCLHQLCDWEWLEDEDGKILKQIPGKAAYSATLVKYAELVCSKPCAQAVLTLTAAAGN